MSLGPQDTAALLDHVHIWLPFCMIEFWLVSVDCMADCVYRKWFLEAFLGPFSNVNDRIMPMSAAVLSEGPKLFQPCVAPVPTFVTLVGNKFEMSYLVDTSVKCIHLNICYVLYVLL